MNATRMDADPGRVREPHVDPDAVAVAESVFSLSNGYVGIRGTLDEVEPSGMRGTYRTRVYETHPLSYPEVAILPAPGGAGGLTVPHGTPLSLLDDGIVLSGCARSGRRSTNARWTCVPAHSAGACRTAQSGAAVEVTSRRLAELRERSTARSGRQVRVDAPRQRRRGPVRQAGRQRGHPTGVDNDDPRVADALDQAFDPRAQIGTANGGAIVERTRRSGITIGAAVAHEVDGGRVSTHVDDQHVVTTVAADLRPGESITIVKMVGYSWSHDALGPTPSSTGVGRRELRTLLRVGGAARRPACRLDELWATPAVEVDGDPELRLRCATPCSGGQARPLHLGCPGRRQGTDRHRVQRPYLRGRRAVRRQP